MSNDSQLPSTSSDIPEIGSLTLEIPVVDTEIIGKPPLYGFTIPVNNEAIQFARKFDSTPATEPPLATPAKVDDLLQKINIQRNIQQSHGPHNATIDVQPDYRNVFLAIQYHVVKLFSQMNMKDDPLLTPSSLTAYLLALIYGHALITDAQNFRNDVSNYANEFISEDNRRYLFDAL